MTSRVVKLVAWLRWLARPATYADQMKGRLSGAQSVEWERGYFTKDRTDLPPSPTRRPPLKVVR